MNIYKNFLAISLLTCISSASAEYNETDVSKEIELSGGISNFIKEMANQLNTQLPIIVSKNKEWTSVTTTENTINYNHRYTVPTKNDYIASNIQKLTETWLSKICNGKMSKILLNRGVTIKEHTSTNNGKKLFVLEANRSTCISYTK